MRTYVRNVMQKYHVRGDILVVKNGKTQNITYGYGYWGHRINNNNAQLVYPSASLQKVITAAMVMQLMEEKKNTSQQFDQNTPVSRWYPQLKNSTKITVGNLLTHTSGIDVANTETNRGVNYSEEDAVNWVINQANAASLKEPNKEFLYNNANYILLAGLISKITGKSYATNLNERISNKLGLSRTFVASQVPTSKIKAVSYNWNKHNYQNGITMKNTVASQIVGAGNLYTTPSEYYKIQVGLTNGQILTQTQFYNMTHLSSRKGSYSGGLYIKQNDKLKLAYGDIKNTHFGTWVQLSNDNKNGIVMFLNQTNNNKNTEKAVGYQVLNHIKKNYFSKK
nr:MULTISPECIES: serine hydrolase domain-containing protein [unclassified Lactobacillus]